MLSSGEAYGQLFPPIKQLVLPPTCSSLTLLYEVPPLPLFSTPLFDGCFSSLQRALQSKDLSQGISKGLLQNQKPRFCSPGLSLWEYKPV
jgi:hypothetical protein